MSTQVRVLGFAVEVKSGGTADGWRPVWTHAVLSDVESANTLADSLRATWADEVRIVRITETREVTA